MRDVVKNMCLLDELDVAHKLIVAGLGDLQEIDIGNDFYHLPHLSLASGLERLMKCYICLVYEARNGNYPDFNYVRNLGHDLTTLSDKIAQDFFNKNNIPIIEEDSAFLANDAQLKRIIHILSEFGQFARYYNLDVVTGKEKLSINPNAEWETLESDIENITEYVGPDAMEALHKAYYPRVHAKIIGKIERFIRAITMQFTLGKHGGKLMQYSAPFTDFITLRDQDQGTKDYRRSVKILQHKKERWVQRSDQELKTSRWPTKAVKRSEFSGDWPFRSDKVVLECREGRFCVVNIQSYDFALNGAAASRYGYPFSHDAGMAILGRSVGPFINMAQKLGKSKK